MKVKTGSKLTLKVYGIKTQYIKPNWINIFAYFSLLNLKIVQYNFCRDKTQKQKTTLFATYHLIALDEEEYINEDPEKLVMVDGPAKLEVPLLLSFLC